MQLLWVPGTACWARDQDRAFVEATVVSVEGQVATVAILGSDEQPGVERSCSAGELLPRSTDQRCVTEMDDLQELNMASVLNNLELLFGQPQEAIPGEGPNTIYSSVGPVLIAMNPFAPLPLYGEKWIRAYRAASGNHQANRALGPHCYRTVEEAHSRLRSVGRQSVVICGESGAGKTVTNRKMLEYLCSAARGGEAAGRPSGVDPEQITEANVLLEAFGNAKTSRNDNSSRFGKYTRLLFDPENAYSILGCGVEHYLLERSRVVSQPPHERNYHIFYQLLRSGAGKEYGLQDLPESYRYTQAGAAVPGFCDAEEFGHLCTALAKAGFSDASRKVIFEAIAAVLHLGNVDFVGNLDTSKLDPDTAPSLDAACALLGVSPQAMCRALTSNVIKPAGGTPIHKEVSVEAARSQRDTVAKTIYSRLFDHIVSSISCTLRQRQDLRSDQVSGEMEDSAASIGLLDIFGFEDMMINGFEQMFINLTNERIQHLFNSIMFERELEAYRLEGITAAFDPGMTNLECVRLFTCPSNPPGIVKLLGESASMKSGRDDAAFVQVLNSSFARHQNFKVCDPQDAQRVARAKGLKAGGRAGLGLDYRECFQVRHYAGTVVYTVKGWVPKSIDALLPHLSDVLCASGKQPVRRLIDAEAVVGKATVGEKFCAQLELLAETLEQGETLFVRCIKSNPQMVQGLVNRPLVLEQLVHGGVISALEMRHRGLPERMAYSAFCAQYGALGMAAGVERQRCEALLRASFGEASGSRYALGRTKVFMKSHVHAILRAAASLRVRNLAKRLQRRWRLHMGTERIRKVEEAWEQLQATQQHAQARGVEALASVAGALRDGLERVGALMRLLEGAREAHGADIQKIAAALPPDRVSRLFSIAEGVDAVVDRVSKRKAAAEQLLGLRLTRAMNGVLKLFERVAAVEAECEDVADAIEPAELQDCLGACVAARRRLEALQADELPELKRQGPVGVDLEGTGELPSEAGVAPRLNELLEQAAGVVAEAESRGHEVLRVRRAFQKAVEEVQGRQEAALLALEALQGSARRCVAEGLDGVVECVDVAWRLQATAQEMLQAARDAEGYRSAVEAFLAAVREAEATVERGREELARREAEEEERRALQAQLDEMLSKLTQRRAMFQKGLEVRLGHTPGTAGAIAEVHALLEALPALRGARSDLAAWRAQVEGAASRTSAALENVDAQLTQATRARQEEFVRRMSMFNASPDKRPEEPPADPASFLRAEGLSAFEGPLLEVLQVLQSMQEAGAPRSGVQRCLNQWMKSTWGGAGGLPFSPAKR
mmetsp:Transcript_85470/g.242326  ORF Transcript_85470/g.242326 Transcript_85470/m.242326 type:complete len:1292 (+) Transcript_85470:51-3926(+)